MTAPARVTIGIPTRNRARLVADLVARCLRQSRDSARVIVSDNASTDGTLQALAAFDHPSLRVLRQERDLGMVGNWNACLAAAETDWFVLLSDDDVVSPDFVENVERAIDAAPDSHLIFMRSRLLNQVTGTVDENPSPVAAGGTIDFPRLLLPAWLSGEHALPLAGIVFRASVLRARGGFDSQLPFAADAATWLPIAFHGPCGYWPQACVDYVIHGAMTTRGFGGDALMKDTYAIHELVLRELPELTLTESERDRLLRNADTFLSTRFNSIMMFCARGRAQKSALLRLWLAEARRLPRGGIGALSVAAVVVPTSLLPLVGWPYRTWVGWRRNRRRAGFAEPPVAQRDDA